ncbi:MAG: carboxypeptidase regulatory-like domain-containing protein [Planctomycetes bacterium]|nr:carboxypeptidase regulatory-like domain-containing protein [Planctomycetota bacterium]
MVLESWKRPSVLVVGWTALLLLVFVLRGDLRVERQPALRATPEAGSGPQVVRAQRPMRADAVALRRGKVLDARGEPAVAAEVVVAGRDPVRTDAHGVFEVAVARGAAAVVTVRAEGHRSASLLLAGDGPEPVLVPLALAAPWDAESPPAAEPRLAVEGRVRTAAGLPLAGAEVHALGSGPTVVTDATGRFVLPVAQTTPTLVVRHAGAGGQEGGLCVRSEPLRLDRERGLVPVPDLVALPAAAIAGTVRDPAGVPLLGLPVRLRGEGLERLVETGAGGAFRIGGLEPGRYELRPFARRGAVGVPTQVVVDRPHVDCELSLLAVAERPLRVVDATGAPVAQATVAVAFAAERTSVHRSDAEGETRAWVAAGDLGDDWEFDVRIGEACLPAVVQRYESSPPTLVVALH